MAGEQITVAVTQVNEQRRGYQNITLTNWTNTNEPEINEGGRVEIQNALYKFAANEDIDASNNWAGFGNDTQIYGYYLVGGGGASVTCELTDVVPTWQEQFGGWYDTASDTNRFWGGIYKDGSGNYADKFIYDGRELKQADAFQIDERGALTTTGSITATGVITPIGGIYAVNYNIIPKVIDIGNWNMNVSGIGTATISIAHGLVHDDIKSVTVEINNNGENDKYPLSYWFGGVAGGVWSLDEPSGNVVLSVTTGGFFDSGTFDLAITQRGDIIIWYKV